MTYVSMHNIFIDRERVTRLDDGQPVEMTTIRQQRARTVCLICGESVVNPDWPTGEWRHMTPAEIARYNAEEAQRP